MDRKQSLTNLIEQFSQKLDAMEAHATQTGVLKEMTMRQLYYLDVIAVMDQPTVSKIAHTMHLTKPTVTAALKQLEDKQYIQKQRSDANKRCAPIQLTKKGQRALKAHKTIHAKMAQNITDVLNADELEQLITIFTKLLEPGMT